MGKRVVQRKRDYAEAIMCGVWVFGCAKKSYPPEMGGFFLYPRTACAKLLLRDHTTPSTALLNVLYPPVCNVTRAAATTLHSWLFFSQMVIVFTRWKGRFYLHECANWFWLSPLAVITQLSCYYPSLSKPQRRCLRPEDGYLSNNYLRMEIVSKHSFSWSCISHHHLRLYAS